LHSKKFDTVFLLHRSFSRALICWLAGIPERIGYNTRKRGFLLTKKIIAPDPHSLHRIDYYLNIIEKAGLRIEDRFPDFYVGAEEEAFVEEFLQKNWIGGGDFVVGINPGGNWNPKRWPKEYWARLADRLISELGAKIIITGSDNDMALARDIKGLMRASPVLACGALNLKQLAALCKRLDLFVTADTGPLHIANASGAKRIIVIFGPTSPEITGPYPLKNITVLKRDVGCKVPCYVVDCKDNRCMKAVSVDEVMEKIRLNKVK
jgi:lipopolysaccharide heptosyltransferase II